MWGWTYPVVGARFFPWGAFLFTPCLRVDIGRAHAECRAAFSKAPKNRYMGCWRWSGNKVGICRNSKVLVLPQIMIILIQWNMIFLLWKQSFRETPGQFPCLWALHVSGDLCFVWLVLWRTVSWRGVLRWLRSGKLTWQQKMDLLKMYLLLKMGDFNCHVSSPEGRCSLNHQSTNLFFSTLPKTPVKWSNCQAQQCLSVITYHCDTRVVLSKSS